MATKYVSALTGPQMDSALTDMAYHNSEAYAVGTRNGVAVSSGDVTYHNNSKYYCDLVSTNTDRAEAAAARAEAAVPASTAGAVFFSTAQSLTTAQQSQARANIMAGSTNPNLLDNQFFQVNQRGDTQITGAGYHLDRWYSYGGYTITESGLSVSTSNLFDQYLESALKTALNGKTITMSALDGDGTVYSATGTYNATPSGNITIGTNGKMRFIITGSGSPRFQPTAAFTLVAAKLEIGSVSTLANDAPPKEDQATADCKWYFQRVQQEDGYTAPVGFGIVAASTNILRTLIPLSSPLRKAGTLTATATNIGQMRVQGNGSNLTPTAITGRGVLNGHAVVDITVNGTLANNQFYTLVFANSTAIVDLSKDL